MAATADVRFRLRPAPVAEALVNLGLQAGVSLGGDLASCKGRSRGLSGRMSLEIALERLLVGSGCEFRLADRQTVVIRRAPPAPAPGLAPPPLAVRPEQTLAEVVVTFPHRAALPSRTPYGVTAWSGRQLEDDRMEDLGALSLGVAGMATTNLGPGRNKIFLRGLSDGAFTGATQSTVALYLDDTPITYNAPDPDLRFSDIDRVEVLRGPQGTLYGGGSIGGIVKLVTRRPDLDAWSASSLVGASATQSGGPSSIIEGVANLPLRPGRLALRGLAYREEQGGYIDDISLGRKNVNKGRREGGRLALRAAFSPEWSATAAAVHQSINTRDTQYASAELPKLERRNAVAEPHDNDFDALSLTVEGEGRWGRLTASSTRLVHQLDSRYDATRAAPELGAGGVSAFDEARHIDLWLNEATYIAPETARLKMLFGAFASTGTNVIDSDLISAITAFPYRERRHDKVKEFAVYGEATARLTERLSATLGARWFHFAFDTRSVVSQNEQRIFSGRADISGVSPKLLISFQASDSILAYAQASQGYRAGGFNTSGPIGQVFDGGMNKPARRYDPDRLWNYELGVKARLFEDRLQLRAAAFLVRWRDVQTDQFLPSGLSYTLNVGDGLNHGLEVEASWRPVRRLEIRAAGLINEPQLTRTNPSFSARSDAGLPGVSKASGNLEIGYDQPLPRNAMLSAKLSGAYVGRSTLTFDAQRTYRMGDYLASKASLDLTAGRYRWTAWVDNALGLTGNTFAFGNPFRIRLEREITPLRPRTFGLDLRVDF
jgi:outer membrane receptor protein involved in Fe transport